MLRSVTGLKGTLWTAEKGEKKVETEGETANPEADYILIYHTERFRPQESHLFHPITQSTDVISTQTWKLGLLPQI